MSIKPPVLITGATGGLGRKTALALARRGRDVIVGGRRRAAVEAVCAEIAQNTSGLAVPFVADLADLAAVRSALDGLAGRPLHGIVANAGITTTKEQKSADGYEITFAVNVLAHQLVLCRLAGQLVGGGRVVVVSSGVHEPDNKLARRAGVPVPRWVGPRALSLPDRVAPDQRLADGRERYATSKLGNILQARGLQSRLRAARCEVDVFAIDPGLMVDTDLAREVPAPLRWVLRGVGRLATPFVDNMRLSSVSAQHIAALIEDPQWRGRGFAYFDGDCEKSPSDDALRDDWVAELWGEAASLIDLRAEETRLSIGWAQ